MQIEFLNTEFLRLINRDCEASANVLFLALYRHMEGSTRCDVLFSGALHFNWGDNKPRLLSCKFVMRLWFSQRVPE